MMRLLPRSWFAICLVVALSSSPQKVAAVEEVPDLGPGGVPMLILPGSPVVPVEPEPIDPADPLADGRTRLREWEAALNLTAESLSDRARTLADREALLLERERALAAREAAVEARENAVTAREKVVRARAAMGPVEPWSGGEAPPVVGRHAIVIDADDGRILHEKAARTRTGVASTQKLMTALLVVEAGALDKEVVIAESDTRVVPSVLGFRPGEKYTRSDLLKWLLVRSGNDVAKALARDNAGSEEAFVAKMNARAAELGMTDTRFKNPHGLTEPDQYSTARDMALLAWTCYQNEVIRECVSTKTFNLTLEHGTIRQAVNTNRVLREFAECNGMKTGYTDAAGSCLITSAERGERRRISVVLGSTGAWCPKDSQVLLDWALSND